MAAGLVLNDFRSGALGRITLETPDEHVSWAAAGAALEAARLTKKGPGKGRAAEPPGDAGG